MTTTLILPWKRPPLTSNEAKRGTGRGHARVVREIRWTVGMLAKSQKVGSHPRSDVLITWWAPDMIHRDSGSLSPTLKAAIDGLVDAGVWPGDHFEWVRTESCRVDLDRTNPRIELTITPVDLLPPDPTINRGGLR